MFIITAKLNKKKAIAAIVALAVLLTAVILFAGLRDKKSGREAMQSIENVKVKTNADRVSFLAGFGWEVKDEPVEVKEILIPREFGGDYAAYNAIQTEQGFELSGYGGVTAVRYSYEVTNYPSGKEKVVADMIVYKNKVIAGDIQSTAADGFMHGFALPE